MLWLKDTAAAILILGIAALVFAQWLFGDQVLYWGDIGLYFHPMSRFLQANLSRGIIPLWNPEILCGTPYVGNPQTWPFYPSTLLLPLLGAARYLIVNDVLHIGLAGLFAYWFLRGKRDGFSAGPALLGALVYMLGGAVVSKAQFPNMLQAIAWVPAVLLLAQRLVTRPGLRAATLFGLALGLQVLCAHAQIVLMTLYLSAAYALFTHVRAVGQSLTPPKLLPPASAWWLSGRRRIGWAAVGGAIGGGIACVGWLPAVELWRHAERQVLSMDTANRFYLPFYELSNFLLPFLHGSPYFGNWTARGNFWETACYLGVVPCLLIAAGSVIALRTRREEVEPLFWIFVFASCVWLALGKYGGLYDAAFHIVPGIKAFHDPARFLMGTALSGAALTAHGAKRLLSRFANTQARKAIVVALTVAIACDLGWFDRHQYPTLPVAQVEELPINQVVLPETIAQAHPLFNMSNALVDQAGGARMLMLDSYEPWRYYVDYRNFHRSDMGFMRSWLQTETPNLPMSDLLPEANGYEPVAPKSAAWRWGQVSNKRVPDIAVINDMSVMTIVTYRSKPLPQTASLLEMSDDAAEMPGKRVTTYINHGALPRARYRGTSNAEWNPVAIETDLPDFVKCTLPPTTSRATFVLADTFYPGWYAQVNGKPSEIQSTANGFRELTIAPGKRRVVLMEYSPGTFVLGLYLTLLSIGAVIGVLIGSGRPGRNNPAPHAARP